MLFGVGIACHILYSVVSYFLVSNSGSITSVGEERDNLRAIMWFLFGEGSTSSGCLGWAALFSGDTPCAFHKLLFCLKYE